MSEKKKLRDQVEKFNRQFPVGSRCLLKRDDGTLTDTRVEGEAFILGGHSVVAWFEGISGCFSASRARPPKDA